MPEYISILRESSVNSIYALLLLVIIFRIIQGPIKDRTLQLFFYIWLPIAVLTQIIMTYFRVDLGKSNLPVMNIYFMFEFILLTIIILKIREIEKGNKIDIKLWGIIFAGGILLHFLDAFNQIHSSAILYMVIIYFHLTVTYIDLNRIDQIIKDPYSILNIGIFTKAFGYSYFLIYQIDYKFPLAIYSGLNLLVQIIFALVLIYYYKRRIPV